MAKLLGPTLLDSVLGIDSRKKKRIFFFLLAFSLAVFTVISGIIYGIVSEKIEAERERERNPVFLSKDKSKLALAVLKIEKDCHALLQENLLKKQSGYGCNQNFPAPLHGVWNVLAEQ